MIFDEDGADFIVLRNDEGQYSIWNLAVAVPGGWDVVGDPGPKADCLALIEAQWTDMRPRSLREASVGLG